MRKNEFLNRIVGADYRFGGRGFDAVDCWGVVELYYQRVLGIRLPIVTELSVEEGLKAQTPYWNEVFTPREHVVFLCHKKGAFSHVGVCISATHCIHAIEKQVRVDHIATLCKIYDRVGFYSYSLC